MGNGKIRAHAAGARGVAQGVRRRPITRAVDGRRLASFFRVGLPPLRPAFGGLTLALNHQVHRVILPRLDATKALAFEQLAREMRMPSSTAKPREWQLDDAACRDALTEYFNKSNHLGEESWLNLLGSIYLSKFEKRPPN
ncbi:MAG TPA: hypothetical protein VNU68_06855 [Verrucomicrobiae bacterium]|nr:hypothetical protein [Verrucomicrobiae bacterium]